MATQSRFGRWSSTTSKTMSKSRTSKAGAGKNPAPGYKQVCDTLNQKIQSYRTLWNQATGPAKAGRPSPTQLNSFAKWVEKGAVVYRVSPVQVKRWTKWSQHIKSATACKTALSRKFGKSAIKAVTTDKTGAFLIACAPTSFSYPR